MFLQRTAAVAARRSAALSALLIRRSFATSFARRMLLPAARHNEKVAADGLLKRIQAIYGGIGAANDESLTQETLLRQRQARRRRSRC